MQRLKPKKPGRPVCFRAASLALLLFALPTARGDDWPAWRGPDGTGVSREKELPLSWSERIALAWKLTPPGWGTSTPIIVKDAIFLTAQQDDALLLVRLEKKTGKLVWSEKVAAAPEVPRKVAGRGAQKFHDIHNFASPSPVTDGEHIVAHYGSGDLAVYDFSGKQLWHRNFQKEYGRYTIWWGHANSPVLVDGLVISVCMQDSLADLAEHADKPAPSYLVAHDVETGKLRWRTPRATGAKAEEGDAYTTPLVQRNEKGTQIIVMGANQVDAFDPADGKQRWALPGLIGGRTVTGPTLGAERLFVTRGMRGPLLAYRLDGSGKPSRRPVDSWEYRTGTPDSCSPVVWDRLLFMVTDDGVARCLDADAGSLKWQSRLKGQYKASPVAADGRVYFLSTSGLCTVISASPRFEKLTENQLDDAFTASPAISDGRIYLRGRKSLYAVEK
ncbi:MAG: PQQ-binding-like beta-propeller repeat protein [Pirellulales bacterium]